VAIKILHKKLIVDARDKMNVSREMRIIKKLRHPNIVQLLQIMETNSKIYLIMESVLGGELYEMIVNSKK
jgi:5'-AMP-activated protein kinase catalytic alpha subunit